MAHNQNQNQQAPQKTSTLQYPIVDTAVNAPMKAIHLRHIPTFNGLPSEDPDAFLFEFDVLCRGYLSFEFEFEFDHMKAAFLKKYQY